MKEKSKKPLISIIVPIYNGEKYLRECIESIISQEYENIEIVLVNDGSQDNSLDIIKKYKKKDNRIIIIDKPNGGVSEARNKALEIIKGDFICMVDQDDTIDTNYISYLYRLIEKTEADIATTFQPYKFVKSVNKKEEIIEEELIVSGIKAAEMMLYYKLVIAPWNKMIRTSLIIKNNISFNEELFGGEGFKFSVDCFKKAKKVIISNQKLYNYRCDNPTSGMTKFRMRIVESSLQAQQLILKELEDDKLKNAAKYANWHTYCDLYNSMIGCNVVRKYKEKYYELKKVVKRDALFAFKSPISKKEKIKAIMYFLNPYITSRIINKFRIRKYTVER